MAAKQGVRESAAAYRARLDGTAQPFPETQVVPEQPGPLTEADFAGPPFVLNKAGVKVMGLKKKASKKKGHAE